MKAGKPSLAIAYAVQRKNKPKKMALGGAVESSVHSKEYSRNPGTPAPKPEGMKIPASESMSGKMEGKPGSSPSGPMITISKAEYDALRSGGAYAKGGSVRSEMEFDEDPRATSIADAILEKKHRMAEGGMVDIEENGEEEGSTPYDDMNADAAKKELYDDDQMSDQPEDSNEHGDEREDGESDKRDRIEAIRRRMRK